MGYILFLIDFVKGFKTENKNPTMFSYLMARIANKAFFFSKMDSKILTRLYIMWLYWSSPQGSESSGIVDGVLLHLLLFGYDILYFIHLVENYNPPWPTQSQSKAWGRWHWGRCQCGHGRMLGRRSHDWSNWWCRRWGLRGSGSTGEWQSWLWWHHLL